MVHPTAVIASRARIGADVEIGPYAVIDEHVVLEQGCRLGAHVHLTGHTRIGANTHIHTGAVIGGEPQDISFDGGVSYLEIGSDCILREYVTINRGAKAESATIIGNHVMLMALAHVGHNCRIADNVIVANASLLAGHVQVGPRAFISAAVGIHQFCRVGTMAMLGGVDKIRQDVPPFCMVDAGAIRGPNIVGLRRAGVNPETRQAIRAAIKMYFFAGLSRPNALAEIRQAFPEIPEVGEFVAFIEATQRGIMNGAKTHQEDVEPEA